MKIEICDNSIFSAGLKKAEQEEYFDALCLFAQVDGYESMLNQIGCHCMLEDYGYAIELYRKLLARYIDTHNCIDDVRRLGDASGEIFVYFGNDLKGAYDARDPNKISADDNMLGDYSWGDDETDYDDDFPDEIVQALPEVMQDVILPESKQSRFFDVGSVEYIDSVRKRMINAYVKGNMAKGRELQRQYLSFKTDDGLTLELQLLMCHMQQMWDKGEEFALRLADNPQATYRGMGMAIEVLYHCNGDKEALTKLFKRISAYSDDIPDGELITYLQIASVCLGYGETTLALADTLYSRFPDIGCSVLSLCARVYFNCGLRDTAREAVLTLLSAAPWDGVGRTLLSYINDGYTLKLSDPTPSNVVIRQYDVAAELTSLATHRILVMAERRSPYDKAEMYYIDCLLKSCYGCIIRGDADGFLQHSAMLETMLVAVNFDDCADAFIRFAKDSLCAVLPEASLGRSLLAKMIFLGCRDKIFVSLLNNFYTLDLGKLTLGNDRRFVNAFALCAALRRVDVRRMERVYTDLKNVLELDSVDMIDERQLSYAMLAVTYKSFPESNESNYFCEDDHAMYLDYKRRL